jgi:hypothetical protein
LKWTKPKYSKKQVNKASVKIALGNLDTEEYAAVWEVFTN